ncbi:hypothetical protein HWV62_32397 [Athelia sp. TMB]|nr:hypothetical protein HWV62_32397 [Athelia sp. TMB]
MQAIRSKASRQSADCEDPNPADTLTDRLNTLLNSSGPGYVLSLCPSQQYLIEAPLLFSFADQEISTVGYPTPDASGTDQRAILVVNGPVFNGTGHTTAVDGTCELCSGVKLRNIQINGTRAGAPPTGGGANIEFGGINATGQLIEYVHSWDPRSWSCLHVAEGGLQCNNVTVQNNDIGPCGSDAFQEWADGISMSCNNSLVQNNMINNPTDGGIVLFGAPGTLVHNNTIWVEKQTLLGGINMVDYDPYNGDFTNTIVTNNTIMGGFATEPANSSTEALGADAYDAICKIGIAIGPRTWFGDQYGDNVSTSGYVYNNHFTGAFAYAIAVSSAVNFTIENNVLFGNTSFLGAVGPNCTVGGDATMPTPQAFVIDVNNTEQMTVQFDFTDIPDADGLTCVLPPIGGDYWPYGGNPGDSSDTTNSPKPTSSASAGSSGKGGSSAGEKAAIALGVILALFILGAGLVYIRKRKTRSATQTTPAGVKW